MKRKFSLRKLSTGKLNEWDGEDTCELRKNGFYQVFSIDNFPSDFSIISNRCEWK